MGLSTTMAIRTTDTSPTEDDWAAIHAAASAAESLLNTAGEEPAEVQAKIQQYVDDVLSGSADNPLGEDVAFALGALWGNSICQAYGWEWIVPIHGDWRGLGVADRERKFLALPFNFFHQLLFEEPNEELPGPRVRFNAIAADHLPESAPGEYTIITRLTGLTDLSK